MRMRRCVYSMNETRQYQLDGLALCELCYVLRKDGRGDETQAGCGARGYHTCGNDRRRWVGEVGETDEHPK